MLFPIFFLIEPAVNYTPLPTKLLPGWWFHWKDRGGDVQDWPIWRMRIRLGLRSCVKVTGELALVRWTLRYGNTDGKPCLNWPSGKDWTATLFCEPELRNISALEYSHKLCVRSTRSCPQCMARCDEKGAKYVPYVRHSEWAIPLRNIHDIKQDHPLS